MKKSPNIYIWLVLVSSTMSFMLASCSIKEPAINSQSPIMSEPPTELPPYIHYTPSEGLNIHLEFDYPSSWTFSENAQDLDFIIIGLGDARFRALPTPSPSPDDMHGTPNDFGSVVIWISPSKPEQTLDTELELHQQAYSNDEKYTELKDYKIVVDGYEAGVLEYQHLDLESSPSLMFNRRIFLIIGGQFYEIYFTIAEKDRGSEFEKGYEYFFNSLKIVP